MRRHRRVAWLLCFLWAAWIFALQGLAAASMTLGRWTPDLGLLMLLALDTRLDRRDARMAATAIALARIAFTSDPPLAVLAGYLTVVGVTRALREVVELDHPLARFCVAGALTLLLSAFWNLSRGLVLAAEGYYAPTPELAWSTALATAFGAWLPPGLFLRLPGLSALRRRHP